MYWHCSKLCLLDTSSEPIYVHILLPLPLPFNRWGNWDPEKWPYRRKMNKVLPLKPLGLPRPWPFPSLRGPIIWIPLRPQCSFKKFPFLLQLHILVVCKQKGLFANKKNLNEWEAYHQDCWLQIRLYKNLITEASQLFKALSLPG